MIVEIKDELIDRIYRSHYHEGYVKEVEDFNVSEVLNHMLEEKYTEYFGFGHLDDFHHNNLPTPTKPNGT
jgi:hypothetical protein